ncbi:hypothetical protein [Luteimonas fraxinea]|uniref:hypothetical protein n=1 Tax=Luteimonas fraxinea TaxID=2901869 RepID=UPI001E403DD7|nr:hypothetical protein [Luteimonas fraxinea]MCD9125866.1 hypothetical protein [Luteimonas fraxinea]
MDDRPALLLSIAIVSLLGVVALFKGDIALAGVCALAGVFGVVVNEILSGRRRG